MDKKLLFWVLIIFLASGSFYNVSADNPPAVIVGTAYPNWNFYIPSTNMWVVNNSATMLGPVRTYIYAPPNKTIHIFKYHSSYLNSTAQITVSEVNLGSLNTLTVTWNNQPSLGSTITTFTPAEDVVEGSWYSFSTGTTGAICLKLTDESDPGEISPGTPVRVGSYFAGFQYPDVTKRPYFD